MKKVLLLVLIALCSSFVMAQDKKKENPSNGVFSISIDSIQSLKYDSTTTPLQIIARNIFADKSFQSSYHLEHTDLELYYMNIFGVSADTLRAYYPNDSLQFFVSSLFKPLITHKNGKKLPIWEEELISFNYELYLTINAHLEAIVLVDEKAFYCLRKSSEGYWRLINHSSLVD